MPVLTLQRSYKYMMYATKQPSLRINQADLKCKNGCGFYGNPDWDGYCSKCYRNHMEKERQKKTFSQSEQVPGFSKFEEKKRQQKDKTKKYLKNFSVFRKSSSSKDAVKPTRLHELRHSNPEIEKLTVEYIATFGNLGEVIRQDFMKCANSFYMKVISELYNKPIDEIAELAQKYYNLFHSRLNSYDIYKKVDHEVKDQLIDFFEKYVMTSLYSYLFCPQSTNDEEKDLTIQERIRKLSWVNAHHLDCCISETSVEVRDLVYAAITDLLGMDSVKAPQEKLSCVVRCCCSVMKVLQHCQGAPVSADEFLPALIFVILKANPARLKSNILYVTRFCNDKRLMQGEGGYYFTNLCCAVSFIENLTSESLNMSEEEFQGYMSGAITSVSAWESALVACEGMHQLYEHLALLKGLADRTDIVQQGTRELRENIEKFKAEISNKVIAALENTPLVVKSRNVPIQFNIQESLTKLPPPTSSVTINSDNANIINKENNFEESNGNFYEQNLKQQSVNLVDDTKGKLQLDISNIYQPTKQEIKISNSSEFNKPDFSTYDPHSLDGITPDEANINYLGLSNINYDIDFSDISGDNSIADELTPERRKSPSFTPDPFSPVVGTCNIMQSPLLPTTAPLTQNKTTDQSSNLPNDFILPFLEEPGDVQVEESNSILDKNLDTPASQLPPPLKPNPQYLGFSKQGFQIPNIPCNTGDFSSLLERHNVQLKVDVKEADIFEGNASTSRENPIVSKDNNAKNEECSKSSDKVVKVLSGVLETFDKLF